MSSQIQDFKLPNDWQNSNPQTFEGLASSLEQIHKNAYTASVKAVNKLATIRNYLIGYYIVEYEQKGLDRAKYGEKLLKNIEARLNTRGMNETLFKNCRRFYQIYPKIKGYLANGISPTLSDEFETPAEKLVTSMSFSHIIEIMTVEDSFARFFYETECIKCCWSVKELRRQIATNLFFRAGISLDPKKLLQQTVSETPLSYGIKEPFTFEFLNLPARPFNESDLEGAIMDHLQEFLLEMGKGFCFEARQKRIVIDDEYYFVDLVFYNRILHCTVIVELKDDSFNHGDLGQLNAYVSYYKENEMNEGDNPPVGILLCTKKGKKMVEYALAGMDNKLFVSTYMLALPQKDTLEKFLRDELG